jgi:hypothetical protein
MAVNKKTPRFIGEAGRSIFCFLNIQNTALEVPRKNCMLSGLIGVLLG